MSVGHLDQENNVVLNPNATATIAERPLRIKNRFLGETVVQVCAERSRIYTNYFKHSDGEPIFLRRAHALAQVMAEMSIVIRDEELIVGGQTKYIRGNSVYPEFYVDWVRKEMDSLSEREGLQLKVSRADREQIFADLDYWQGICIEDRTLAMWREQWGERVELAIQARVFHDMTPRTWGRCAPDYADVIQRGLSGIIAEAQAQKAALLAQTREDMEKQYFWASVILSCQGVIRLARRYAELARRMAAVEENATRRNELEMIANSCNQVPENPARSFHEALQALWFIHLAIQIENNAPGYSPGRIDQYLYPLYVKDIKAGLLTREKAAELLGCLWVKFAEIERFKSASYQEIAPSLFQNITIGGQTAGGRDATNELSYLILDVTEAMRLPQPTISLRYFDGLSEKFLLRAAEVIRNWGAGIPALFNDRVALSTLPYYGVQPQEARNWVPVGCVEMGLPASTPLYTGSGFLSLAKCLELALHNGFDFRTGKQVGPTTGDPSQFNTFTELWQAFCAQAAYSLDTMCQSFNMSWCLQPELVPTPFLSSVMNDCLKKGKDLTQGGGRYNRFNCWMPREVIDAANSLTAIQEIVFEQKRFNMAHLLAALDADFEGYEELRRQLLDASKYGNNDDKADGTVDAVYQFCKQLTEHHRNQFGEPLSVAFLGITSHYYFGKAISALPSGRKAYTPCADGSLSAYPGTDYQGPTSLINSATKIDYFPALSTLLNIKFHPQVLKGKAGLRKMLALIKTYFDQSGYHIQFNVLDRETLLRAKESPEEYRDLVVRVAGFSMFWVELAPHIQDEIIARTEHVM